LFLLQSIPRRLALNFSDVTQKGFPFDIMKGDFNIVKGEGTTQNVQINGPIAWVQIKGKVGFAKKDLNLRLEIIPNITSTLPLVATVAGGPIAGAITWVASKLVGKQVGKAAHVIYDVKGKWDKPQVVKGR